MTEFLWWWIGLWAVVLMVMAISDWRFNRAIDRINTTEADVRKRLEQGLSE